MAFKNKEKEKNIISIGKNINEVKKVKREKKKQLVYG